jgi:hypothetical protein
VRKPKPCSTVFRGWRARRKFGDALDDVAETAEGAKPSVLKIDNAGDASQRCETLYARGESPTNARLLVDTGGKAKLGSGRIIRPESGCQGLGVPGIDPVKYSALETQPAVRGVARMG